MAREMLREPFCAGHRLRCREQPGEHRVPFAEVVLGLYRQMECLDENASGVDGSLANHSRLYRPVEGAAIPTDDRLSDFGVEGLRIEQEPIHVVNDVRN